MSWIDEIDLGALGRKVNLLYGPGLTVERRMVAQPLGSFSLAGTVTKVSARERVAVLRDGEVVGYIEEDVKENGD